MYDRILVAIDSSETSNAALGEAIRLGQQTPGSTLRLVMVVEIPAAALTGEGANLPAIERTELDAARTGIAEAKVLVSERGLRVETATPEALGTSVAQAILDDAREWEADVIVIGTHGRSGWRRFILGSVAEEVARTADRPVLLVHHRSAETPHLNP